jgi:glutamyl-Q tRNA(Asp) synthetase
MQPVFRFAPSPTGRLHLGHALSALIDFELCQRAGGRFLLRIEDTDPTRCRPEYEAAIHEDLRWLGLAWEEPVRRQSEHLVDYREALQRLAAVGLVYPAFMGRGETAAATASPDWPRDPDGIPLYPGADRGLDPAERAVRLAAAAPHALRLDMNAAVARAGRFSWAEEGSGPRGEAGSVAAHPEVWGDVMLAGRDRPATYHLAVVVDDALQGVTHVVRGQDLFYATSVHVLLQRLLGLPSPVYHHHRLILGRDGRKLSKAEGSQSLASLRANGVTPGDVRRMVGLTAR